MTRRQKRKKNPTGASYEIRVVGARRAWVGDSYHAFLRMPWTAVIALLSAGFMIINAAFALLYLAIGGVAHARPGSFWDAFNFSVQTLGTIGYGVMYPESDAANGVVLAESVVSVVVTALATGLVFAKFARPVGRLAFSHHAVVSLMDGIPTLQFRVGNERGNSIVEATVKVALVRTVKTKEGSSFYRMIDLKLVRERSPAIARSWNVLHVIDESSPLFGCGPERMAREDAELLVSVAGTDDTSYQPVFARHTYEHFAIKYGARFVDILSETPQGDLVLDVRLFHDIVPTEPTEAFPYPTSGPAPSAAAE
jgi:inward rectifier potassium channel